MVFLSYESAQPTITVATMAMTNIANVYRLSAVSFFSFQALELCAIKFFWTSYWPDSTVLCANLSVFNAQYKCRLFSLHSLVLNVQWIVNNNLGILWTYFYKNMDIYGFPKYEYNVWNYLLFKSLYGFLHSIA